MTIPSQVRKERCNDYPTWSKGQGTLKRGAPTGEDIVCASGKPGESSWNRAARNTTGKHHVASNYTSEQDGWNEVSFRYSHIASNFYVPRFLHTQNTSNKQKGGEQLDKDSNDFCRALICESCIKAFDTYDALLEAGVAREEARVVLPRNTYTSFIWTTSLMSVLNFMDLRFHPAAQEEITRYAECIDYVVKHQFPIVHKYYYDHDNDNSNT